MGKAARNKKNSKNKKTVRSFVREGRDPAAEGSFAAGGEVTRFHEVNKFLLDMLTSGDEFWVDLDRLGRVDRPTPPDFDLAVNSLLDHPKVATFRTDGGHTMRGYINGRMAEQSLDAEYIPALIIVEFHARALINALYQVHAAFGHRLNASEFDQVSNGISSYMRQLAAPFPELDFAEIERVAVQKARWRGADVLLHTVVFPKAA
ncbi:hypothetical protein AB0P00_13655 [Microbacterium sp. NPDC077057]|uniref:hypothetical protein n=1 Tax=Microbacterium sp. NPDC077057 TaxID=3154763 RepID=UPI00341468E3